MVSKSRSDSRCIFLVEPAGQAVELDVRRRKKRGLYDNAEFFLSSVFFFLISLIMMGNNGEENIRVGWE